VSDFQTPDRDGLLEAVRRILERNGHELQLVDPGGLEAALQRPLQRQHYGPGASREELVAALGFSLGKIHHCLADGDKRMTLVAIYAACRLNGLWPDWSNRQAVEVILGLAAGEISEAQLAAFIRDNCIEEPPPEG
jgi:death-on-curing protein